MTKPSLLGQASQPGSHLGHLHIYGFGIHRPFLSVVLPWHVVGTSLSALAFLLRPLSTPVWCEQLWGKKAQWLAAPCGPIALLVLLTVDRTWREPSEGCRQLVYFLLLAQVWTERKTGITYKWLQVVSVPFSKEPLQCKLQKPTFTTLLPGFSPRVSSVFVNSAGHVSGFWVVQESEVASCHWLTEAAL